MVALLTVFGAALYLYGILPTKLFITRVLFAGLGDSDSLWLSPVHFYDLREVFGGDANTYDYVGNRLMEIWTGRSAF